MRHYFRIIWPCLLAALIFTGCRKEKEEPSLTFPETTVEVAAQGGAVSVAYNLQNPSPSWEFSAITEDEWIDRETFDFSESGLMKFTVSENTEEDAREGFINVTYGSIQERLRVVQAGTGGAGPVQDQELVMEVLAVTDSSVTCSITPADDNLTYCCMAVLREEFDKYAGGSLETFYGLMLDNYEMYASQLQLSLEEFLTLNILMTGYQEFTIPEMTYNTEYLLVYVGMDTDGTQLTDIFSESVVTEDIDRVDVTFDIEYDLDYAELLMKVTPSDNNIQYFFNVVAQDELDARGMTLEEWNQSEISTTIAFLKQFFGLTDMREILEDYVGVSYGPDEYAWRNDESMDYDASLWLGKDYVGAAFALDMEGRINSDLEVKSFRTQDADPSSNQFTVTLDAANVDYVEYSVECTNEDSWYAVVAAAYEYAGMTDEEILGSFAYRFHERDARILHRGGKSLRTNNLYPETDYVIYVFGYEYGMTTTDLTKVEFTTLQAGDPSTLEFDFSVDFGYNEHGNMTADVTVVGTPASALYWTGLYSESATEEDVLAEIEAGVEQFEGWGMNRLSYFLSMGERGTFTYPYPVNPGSRIKVAAVGVNEETGELATDIVFSEVYQAPSDGQTASVQTAPEPRPVIRPVERIESPVFSPLQKEQVDRDDAMPDMLRRVLAAREERSASSDTERGLRLLLPVK